MLKLIYKILKGCSKLTTYLSDHLQQYMEHKKVCKYLWKERSNVKIIEGNVAKAIIIKKTEFTDSIQGNLETLLNYKKVETEAKQENEILPEAGFIIKEVKFTDSPEDMKNAAAYTNLPQHINNERQINALNTNNFDKVYYNKNRQKGF